MSRRARGRIGAVALVTLVALGLGLAATVDRMTGPSMGASVATGTAVVSDGRGLVVETQPGVTSPLRPGDVVEAIAGYELDDWSSFGRVRVSIGSTLPVRVERDGSVLDIAVPVAAYPAGSVLVGSAGTLAFCLVFAFVAAFVFWRRPADPAAGALLIAASGTLGSTVPFLLGMQPLDLVTGGAVLSWAATLLVYLLLWVGAAHFALVFPRPLPFLVGRPWIEPGLYVAVLGAYGLAAVVAMPLTGGALEWFSLVNGLQYVVIVAALAATAVGVAVQWRLAAPGGRRVLRGVALALGFTIVASFVVWLVPQLVIGAPLVPWSVEGLIGLPVPLALAAAVLRHRAFDIDVVVRRSVVYGGLTAAIVATYAASVAVLGRVIVGDQEFAISLLSTGVAALVALPARDLLQRGVGRLLFGDRREPVRAIRRLGERLEMTLEGDSIPRVVVDTVADSLRVPYVALEVGLRPSARVLAERGEPRDGTVALPLVYGSRPLGSLVVANRQDGEQFSADDFRLLGDLARHVGAAIHASLLAEDLQRSREQIVAAREEERRRLRRDLHDGLGPALAAIGMRAETGLALMREDRVAAESALIELGAEVRSAVQDVRRIVEGLRPPAIDEIGLRGAVKREADRLEAAARPVRFCVEAPDELPELPAAVEVAAYRIVIEAMTNVVRHAGAGTCNCTIRLEADDVLSLEVSDDGVGLPSSPREGVGLGSMRERAAELGGECVVERGPAGGTLVRARLPIRGGLAGGGDVTGLQASPRSAPPDAPGDRARP